MNQDDSHQFDILDDIDQTPQRMSQDDLCKLITQAAREGWTELDLRDQVITELPPEIGRLTDLQRLSIGLKSNQWIASTYRNPLKTLPSEIAHLTQLRELDLRWNQLTTMPPEICQLTSLTLLDLRGNRLTALPPEIRQLSNLASLELSLNELAAVPPEIGQLTSLTLLELSHNYFITTVPPEIGQLTNLTSLDLSNNQLTTLPPEIGGLHNLQILNLSANYLEKLPIEIGNLANLRVLLLGADEGVPLKYGFFDGPVLSGLTYLPASIGQLTRLQELYLCNNQLTAVPPEIGQLSSLTLLDLRNNKLTVLPSTLRRLRKLEELYLSGNAFSVPTELLDRKSVNTQAFLDAYFQAGQPLREAKLLLVGEGDVGKTAIIARLLHNRFSDTRSKTVGVDIHRWEVESEQLVGGNASGSDQRPLQVNVWDFGGQEIYHTTHQFFLTHRSLYLLVLDATKDEAANRLKYWLRHIQSFAGDAPILLVINKSDQHRSSLDERGLLLQYPAIRAIVHTSCKSGDGLDALRQAIDEALTALPHINDEIPITWFAVKEKLTALDKDFLPYESYEALCESEGVTDDQQQQILSKLLHDLGAALHFHDDRRLAGTHVLNPEWVTGGLYAILNAPALQERGILRLDELDAILDRRRYPPHKHPFLLDIMGKFELAAPLADGQHFLIPGLLPKERPAFEWPAAAPVALEYRYAILPAAILSRLMVRLHHHIWQPESGQPVRWRNGLGVARDGCRALIVADPEAARLTIALDGPAPHRRHLLALIRAQLDEIHASFAKLEAEEWVPIPGKPDKAIAYEHLLFFESQQEWQPLFAPIKGLIDVRALLDGIESPEERDIRALVQQLTERFNRPELRQLAFNLGVDHENLPYDTRTDLARELALFCERNGRSAELARMVGKERP
jgi:internalin A